MKIILLILMTLALANCTKTMTGKSSANATYKVKEEGTNDAILNKVLNGLWMLKSKKD